ncbi:MAG: 23S rRNA (pseudouridine(1915)-N(3))-methyltransferase RlmH [Bacilli bacterium]|nr:23S rRNA (pseudouridine(1915)-N(3))-methyltransferase RlmH [Bacilli bacterium]
MIKIICVGKLKEGYLKEAIEEYKKRISKYTKLEIIEVKDYDFDDKKKTLEMEKNQIIKYIGHKDYVITLEVDAEELTSKEFAKKIDFILTQNSNLCFIIGGSYGLDDAIKKRTSFRLSFSKLTFPHQLFRVLLLEQIYRSYKINNNESYHK